MFEMRIADRDVKIALIIFLGICAVFDIKKREIPVVLILLGGICAVGLNLYQIFNGEIAVASIGSSFLIGLIFLAISFCTREKVGYADGLILLVSGLVLGFEQCLLGLCLALLLSSIYALWLLLMRKARRNSALPFVPFLTIGMGVGFFV